MEPRKSSSADLFMENMHSNVTAVKISLKMLLRILCPGLADQYWDNNSSYGLWNICYLSRILFTISVKYVHDTSFDKERKWDMGGVSQRKRVFDSKADCLTMLKNIPSYNKQVQSFDIKLCQLMWSIYRKYSENEKLWRKNLCSEITAKSIKKADGWVSLFVLDDNLWSKQCI